jgi:hypothetical protein
LYYLYKPRTAGLNLSPQRGVLPAALPDIASLQPVVFADDYQVLNISAWICVSTKNPRLEIMIQEISTTENAYLDDKP